MENQTNSEEPKVSTTELILDPDFELTVLISSIVLVILVLLSILVACILHRKTKRRRSRMLRPRSPVILANEPGRDSDQVLILKRLFIDHIDDQVPEYKEILISKSKAQSNGRQWRRKLPTYFERNATYVI